MTIEEAVNSLLRESDDLTEIVKTRIRPFALTQTDKRPCVAYQVTNREYFDHMTGSNEWQRVTIQVDCWADTYREAATTSALIRSALQNYEGDVTNDDNEGIEVGFLKHRDESDLSELPEVGQSKPTYRLSNQFLILYRVIETES